jgi:putative glycosyltransferase (TIGR04372 family)
MTSQMGKMAPQQMRPSFSPRSRFTRWFGSTFQFLMEQMKKTMRRPSRILIIPFGYLAHWLMARLYGSHVVVFLFGLLPDNELIRRRRLNYYFESGNCLLQKDQPSDAWEWYDRCLQESTNSFHFFAGAVGLFHGLGRFREARSLFARANELRQQSARELGVTDCRFRLLDQFWAGNFGHSAVIDYVVKLGILEGRSRNDTIFFVPPQAAIANRCLVEQWHPHLRLIECAEDLPFRADAVNALRFDYLGPRLDDGSTPFYWELAAKTYRRWYAEKRPPLLALPSDIGERGRRTLRSKGVPDDAWFVGMHVREAGSKRHHKVLHQVLNADVMSFLPAIGEITKRGGWVIRMGDPSMVRLPPIPNVVDYCHSDVRSDWMDVFITARCRFFLGTSSGPAYLPPLYGIPSVLTNWWPPAQRPWHPMDIFMPKMVRRKDNGEALTLSETLAEPYSYCHSLTYLEQGLQVYIEDTDAEDIRAAVAEMFDRLEGSVRDDAEGVALRDRVRPGAPAL